jgi:predicted DNA-binding protein
MDKAVISIELPVELDDCLKAEAKSRLTSKSAVVREILAAHVRKSSLPQIIVPPTPQPQEQAA